MRISFQKFVLAGLILLGLFTLSIVSGIQAVSIWDCIEWIYSNEQASSTTDATFSLLTDVRLPRSLAGLFVGAALGLSGALMQSLTRNPLAEPGLLGVNAGAALAVVCGMTWAGATGGLDYLIWAFGGAFLATFLILAFANRFDLGNSPAKLVLVGIAIGATCQGISSFIMLSHQASLDEYRFWVLGSLAGVDFEIFHPTWVAIVLGCLGTLMLYRPISAIRLGDDFAQSLGYQPDLIRIAAAGVLTLLAGSAVAICGPLTFLGLMAPYMARTFCHHLGLQWLLSAWLGALLLMLADIGARLLIQPFEIPVGVILTLIGAPLLIQRLRRDSLSAAAKV